MALSNELIVKIRKQVVWLIVIATAVRMLLASQLELANDEVYYWTYVRFPDLSHFDHPPMAGFLAQLFTANLFFSDDFFLRLGSIVLSAASTWTIFCIGRKVKNELAGLYAAFLYTSSIYCSIISGFSLIPDAPQVFFWLLTLNVALDVLPVEEINKTHRIKMIAIGLFAGLAMLSKYHSVFIWLGIWLYVVFQNRKWLFDYSFYVAGFVSLLVFSPVVIWNVKNNFISFTFHGDRVAPALEIRPDYFLTEIAGQVAYNNPLNIVLVIIALVALFKGKQFIDSSNKWILLFNSIPLWLLFTGFSIFRSTLPHWSGPAFLSLIVITGAYWSERISARHLSDEETIRPFRILLPNYFLVFLLAATVYVINFLPVSLGKHTDVRNFGEYDFTQDMFGYDQIEKVFRSIAAREELDGNMKKSAGLVSSKWFPGAHLDFYVAQPNQRKLFMIGNLNDIHKYAWINEQQGGLQKGENYYHIAVSNYYRDPTDAFGNFFETIQPLDTLRITRGGETMRYAFFYKLKNYQGNFTNPLTH